MVGAYKYCLVPRFVLERIIRTKEMFSESQLYQRKEQKLKRKTRGEQQQADFPVHRLDARFVYKLRKCVYFSGQTGSAS